MSRASIGLSSIKRTLSTKLSWSVPAIGATSIRPLLIHTRVSLGGQFYNGQPKIFYGFNHFHEMVQVHRLGNIAICIQLVCLQNVIIRLGSGEHHHRNPPEAVIGLDFGQQFAAIFTGPVSYTHLTLPTSDLV